MVTAMTTIKQGNYAREAKFVDDYWSKLRKAKNLNPVKRFWGHLVPRFLILLVLFLIVILISYWRKCMGIEPTYRLQQTAHRI